MCVRPSSPHKPFAENRGADPGERGPLLNRYFEVLAPAPPELAEGRAVDTLPPPPVAQLAQAPEVWPGLFRVAEPGRKQHQSFQPRGPALERRPRYAGYIRFQGAKLRRLAREIDLDEQVRSRTLLDRRRVHAAYQIDRVNRMNGRKGGRRLPDLVRLEVADQVPPDL